jgi:hypothetical protein
MIHGASGDPKSPEPIYQPLSRPASPRRVLGPDWREIVWVTLTGAVIVVLPPAIVGLALGAEEAGLWFIVAYFVSAVAGARFASRRLARTWKQGVLFGALAVAAAILLPLPIGILVVPINSGMGAGIALMPFILLGFGIVVIPVALLVSALSARKRLH